MTVNTRFKIYYIDPITSLNNLLNFREPNQPPALEATATLLVSTRSMTNLMIEVQRALNDAGENAYTVSFNRITRLVTIAADDTFELPLSTGSNVGLSPFSLLGFTSGSDLTGASTYTGTTAIGSSYVPQFKPQSFKSFDNNLEGIETTTSESADGTIHSVSFGNRRFMEFNIFGATNLSKTKGNPIENNPTGVDDINALMQFLITKSAAEFMINRDDVNSFDTIILERTKQSRSGTSYELNELVSQSLNNHYETKVLKFRRVE